MSSTGSDFETHEHSPLGASSASRWLNCPGSIRLCKQLPPEASNEFARLGTAAHELGEYCLRMGFDPLVLEGQTITVKEHDGEFDYEVDEDMAEAVQVYVDTVREYVDEDTDFIVEERFQLKWIDPVLFGTNDFSCFVPKDKMLVVIDYKHGQGVPVDAENNKQLMYYALGARKRFPKPENVRLVIVQPRAPHVDGPVRVWDTTPEALDEFEAVLKAGVAETRKEDAALKTGNHCLFCPARAQCPQLHNESMLKAQAAYEPVQKVFQLPDVKLLSKEDITRVLESMDIFNSWLGAVAKHAENLAISGEHFDGFKLVRSKKNAAFIDKEEAKKQLAEKFGDEVFKEPELKGLGDLAKVIKAKQKLSSVKKGREVLNEWLHVPMGDIVLAPESDPREGIPHESVIEGLFEPVEEAGTKSIESAKSTHEDFFK